MLGAVTAEQSVRKQVEMNQSEKEFYDYKGWQCATKL